MRGRQCSSLARIRREKLPTRSTHPLASRETKASETQESYSLVIDFAALLRAALEEYAQGDLVDESPLPATWTVLFLAQVDNQGPYGVGTLPLMNAHHLYPMNDTARTTAATRPRAASASI